MTTTHNVKKLAGKALLSGAAALVALGLASGTAQAFNPQPGPAGQADRRWHARSANTLATSTRRTRDRRE